MADTGGSSSVGGAGRERAGRSEIEEWPTAEQGWRGQGATGTTITAGATSKVRRGQGGRGAAA